MKKNTVVAVAAIFLFVLFSCKSSGPSVPEATQTPNATLTIESLLTVIVQQQTAAASAWSPTVTPTVTVTPNVTQTFEAMATYIAQQQTAQAAGWTSTHTPTHTATPNVTQTIEIMLTSISQQQTAGVVAAQTAAAVATRTTVMNFTNTGFAAVPGGSYSQSDGSASFDHDISQFYMGQYEVTYELWYAVCLWAAGHGYFFDNAGNEGHDGIAGAAPTVSEKEPVTAISWRDIIVWCNAYSELAGFTPVYFQDAAFTAPLRDSRDGSYPGSVNANPGSFDEPYVNWGANGFRLPTEGEWQYAASYTDGMVWSPYNYISGDSQPYTSSVTAGDFCWYNGNSSGISHDTGIKTPNTLVIYDMSGNVWEWVWDWYGSYPITPQINYRGPGITADRIIRGGSFGYGLYEAQLGATRGTGWTPWSYAGYIGFRLARSL